VERTGHQRPATFPHRAGPPFTTTSESFMIDRDARNRLAEGIRHLVAGITTNDEFEDRSLSRSKDLAIHAVFAGGPWFLYHDVMRHRLRGQYRVSPSVRREAARWVLFLKTDLPYEWPVAHRGFFSSLLWLAMSIATLGFFARAARRQIKNHGDITVWPFIRRADYEASLRAPPYLAKPSNPRPQGDAPEAARA